MHGHSCTLHVVPNDLPAYNKDASYYSMPLMQQSGFVIEARRINEALGDEKGSINIVIKIL